MKKLILGLLLFSDLAQAADMPYRLGEVISLGPIKVGSTAPANSKAVFDIESTTKGVLFPRLTTTQRNAISSPPTGLSIYNTTATEYEAYNGSSWSGFTDISDTVITGKLLTGFSAAAGTVSASDSILTAFDKVVGNLALKAPLASPTFTGTVTGTFLGNLTGNVTGNADTSTALASNPTDCGANTYATTIAANGNLTCASITNASTTATSANTASTIVARDGSGNFSAGTITAALSGNATTSTALASNPTDCSAGSYASAIDAQGNLTCSAVVTSFAKNGSSGITGAATISAGSGVTLTQAGNDVQIAAVSSSAALQVTTKTANYTIQASDDRIRANSTAGSFTLTLPSAAANSGKVYYIKLKGTNPVTIAPNGSDTIDDETSQVLDIYNTDLIISSDGGTSWDIL